jgi:hypothetical protein
MPSGFTDMAITKLLDGRRGRNARHTLGGLFRQSVFGRLAGYEDVNDAERLARDPAMRAIVGREVSIVRQRPAVRWGASRPVLQRLPTQRGAAPASRARLQPR